MTTSRLCPTFMKPNRHSPTFLNRSCYDFGPMELVVQPLRTNETNSPSSHPRFLRPWPDKRIPLDEDEWESADQWLGCDGDPGVVHISDSTHNNRCRYPPFDGRARNVEVLGAGRDLKANLSYASSTPESAIERSATCMLQLTRRSSFARR